MLTFSFKYFLTPIELCIPIFCLRFPARTTATVTRTSVSRATRKKRHSSPEMRRTPVATFSMRNLLTPSSPASNGDRLVTPFASTAATWPSERLAIGNDAIKYHQYNLQNNLNLPFCVLFTNFLKKIYWSQMKTEKLQKTKMYIKSNEATTEIMKI